jgi:hypothetical protein
MPIVEDPLVGRDIASGALPDPRRYAIGFVAVGDDDDTLAIRCGAQLLNYIERFVVRAYENKIDIFIGSNLTQRILFFEMRCRDYGCPLYNEKIRPKQVIRHPPYDQISRLRLPLWTSLGKPEPSP